MAATRTRSSMAALTHIAHEKSSPIFRDAVRVTLARSTIDETEYHAFGIRNSRNAEGRARIFAPADQANDREIKHRNRLQKDWLIPVLGRTVCSRKPFHNRTGRRVSLRW